MLRPRRTVRTCAHASADEICSHAHSARHLGLPIVVVGADDTCAPEQALREALGQSAFELTILPGIDHYLLGGGARKLAETLSHLAL